LINILLMGVLLSIGREVFLPLAVATLVTLALTPAVGCMRVLRSPRIASVFVVVTLDLQSMAHFSLQTRLSLPSSRPICQGFRANITAKMARLQTAGERSNLLGRLADCRVALKGETGFT
jgi:hypothetical protein